LPDCVRNVFSRAWRPAVFRTVHTLTDISFPHTTSFSIHRYTIVRLDDSGGVEREVSREDRFAIFAFAGYYFRAPFHSQGEAETKIGALFDGAQRAAFAMTAEHWTDKETDVTFEWGEAGPTGRGAARAAGQSPGRSQRTLHRQYLRHPGWPGPLTVKRVPRCLAVRAQSR